MLEEENGLLRIALLGATGSVGRQTLDVIRAFPGRFRLQAASVGSDAEALEEIHRDFSPPHLAMARSDFSLSSLRSRFPGSELYLGEDANASLCGLEDVDAVVIALPGMVAIHPLLAAARENKRIAVANKECLVCGGDYVRARLEEWGTTLYPVDSEQSAIFQCLQGLASMDEVTRLILTASGGPFREKSREELGEVSPKQALEHPNWKMGRKISIDSATMVNKGLEVIEAHYLFDVAPERIEVLIHPQSLVHSMVETIDGAVLAQLGQPDMRLPIQYALTHPQRLAGPVRPMGLADFTFMEFREADTARFPALAMAYDALSLGGTATAIYNAADEVAVDAFLAGEISFLQIEDCIEDCLSKISATPFDELEIMLEADRRTRERARAFCREKGNG